MSLKSTFIDTPLGSMLAISDEEKLYLLDSPFGGTNLHLPDGEALACHVRHDALAS